MVDFKSLGHNLRKIRVDAALSQEELAERCSCCGSYIGKIENGKALPSLEMIVKIANVLDTTVDVLLMGVPQKTESAVMETFLVSTPISFKSSADLGSLKVMASTLFKTFAILL